MRTSHRLLFALVLLSSVVGVVAAARGSSGGGSPRVGAPVSPAAVHDGAAERLAGAIRIPTVSTGEPGGADSAAFAALHDHLEASFPRVHRSLERETVAAHSLLYTWRGSDPSLPPILLVAHMDVVPVEPEAPEAWRARAFSGAIEDGFVWGRGAIDNKSAVIGTLEAIELLLAEGFAPTRTVHLAFGHDEEVGGMQGARAIAALLERRGARLAMVLDEGGVIGDGLLAGVGRPVALVGVAEKGFVSVELSVRAAGGHSSLPPRESAIGILGAAVARLEAHPMPARLEGATAALFGRVGPLLPLPKRAALAGSWLTRPLVLRGLGADPTTNAMVRTTTATTVFEAGTKDNVLPTRAQATVNFRILPGDSIADVLEHVRRAIDEPRVEIRVAGAFSAEPSAVSGIDTGMFRALERSIAGAMPEAIVAPYLVVVATDARHYARLSDAVYRFLPVRLSPRDLERMHGVDERIAVADYQAAVRTYRAIVIETAGRREAAGP